MELTKNKLLVVVGCVVAVVVGATLFGVAQDLGADPVVVEEAVEGDAPATEAAAEGEGEVSAGDDTGVSE